MASNFGITLALLVVYAISLGIVAFVWSSSTA